MKRIRLSLLLIVAGIFVASCGGGGGGGSPPSALPSSGVNAPSPNQPSTPSPNTINIVGTVYLADESSSSLTPNLYGNSWVLGPRSFQLEALNNNTDDLYQSNFSDYLCYGVLEEFLQNANKDLTSILKDIDVNDDNVSDVNLSYGPDGGLEINRKAYKNISRNSFIWNEIPSLEQIQAEGYSSIEEFFRPTDFLFDLYSDLEPNIDLDGDQIPDENITVNFSLDGISLLPTNLIFYNIRLPNSDSLINKIIKNESEQPFDLSLINHDVNFDGIPDINFDYDYDEIADTKLDDDGDCIGDINIVDGAGITVDGAEVSISEIKDTNGDGYYDVIEDSQSVFSDQDGKFVFENLQIGPGGKTYKLVVIKDRGDKKVWSASVFTINEGTVLDFDIGAITLTSGPIIMGVEYSFESPGHKIGIPLYGKLNVDFAREINFLNTKNWVVKLFVQDINNSDVVRPVYYWDIEENKRKWRYLPFTPPEFTNSGYYEKDFPYEIRNTDCYNNVLDSTSPYYQNKAMPGDEGLSFCYGTKDSDGNIDFSSVRIWSDYFGIHNSDEVYSAVTYSEHGYDISVDFTFVNSAYEEPIHNFDIKSITVNGQEFQYINEIDSSISDGRNIFRVEADSDTLIVDIQTKIESARNGGDVLLTYILPERGFISEQQVFVGDNVSINLSSDFPLYTYQILGNYCLTIDPGQNFCGNNVISPAAANSRSSKIFFTPKINQKPAIMRDTYVNETKASDFFNNSIVQVGDTLNFTILFEDPNQLANEVQWITPEGVRSGWMKPDEPFAYTILTSDIGDGARISYEWRNNDGVAQQWVCSSCSGANDLYESDGSWSISFQVSE